MSAGWLAEQANRPRVVYEERATDVRGRARKKAELKKLDAESKVLQVCCVGVQSRKEFAGVCQALACGIAAHPRRSIGKRRAICTAPIV